MDNSNPYHAPYYTDVRPDTSFTRPPRVGADEVKLTDAMGNESTLWPRFS